MGCTSYSSIERHLRIMKTSQMVKQYKAAQNPKEGLKVLQGLVEEMLRELYKDLKAAERKQSKNMQIKAFRKQQNKWEHFASKIKHSSVSPDAFRMLLRHHFEDIYQVWMNLEVEYSLHKSLSLPQRYS